MQAVPLISNIFNTAVGIAFAIEGTSTSNRANILSTVALGSLSIWLAITLMATIKADRSFKKNSLATATKD